MVPRYRGPPSRHDYQSRLRTFVDPRLEGGKINDVTKEDIVEVIELGGEEWLWYHPHKIDVAIIRGTTADEDGNVTMDGEIGTGEPWLSLKRLNLRRHRYRSGKRCSSQEYAGPERR